MMARYFQLNRENILNGKVEHTEKVITKEYLLLKRMSEHFALTIKEVMEGTGLSRHRAKKLILNMQRWGYIKEFGGKQNERI